MKIISYNDNGDKPIGTQLIRDILKSNINVDISLWNEQQDSTNYKYDADVELISVEIKYNPNFEPDILTETFDEDLCKMVNENLPIPNFISLGHELIHAIHHMTYTDKPDDVTAYMYKDEFGINQLSVHKGNEDDVHWAEELSTVGIDYWAISYDGSGKVIQSADFVRASNDKYTENALRAEATKDIGKRVKYQRGY